MITALYYLENSEHERKSLNIETDSIFLSAVSGLGTSFSDEFTSIGGGFFPLAKNAFEQEQITGSLNFVGDAFEDYRDLIDWMMSSARLFFVYCPFGSREFYREVKVNSITKGQRNGMGRMQADIELNCLTPWFLSVPTDVDIKTNSASFSFDSGRYNDGNAYAESYARGFSAEIQPTGHIGASVVIDFKGAITNPVITCTGNTTGNVYGQCKVATTLTANDTIELSTDYLDSYVIKRSGTTTTDLMPSVDLTSNPFFRLPVDESCTIDVTGSNDFTGECKATINYYYRSV